MTIAICAAVLAAALPARAPAQIADHLPGGLGIPSNAPARPATPYDYPAVHDMPPDRSVKTLNEDERKRLERDLTAIRDRQRQNSGQPPVAPAAKKKPAAAPAGTAAAGASRNP